MNAAPRNDVLFRRRYISSGISSIASAISTRSVVSSPALGNEPELVRLLLRVERAERDWRSGIELIETQNASDVLAWQRAVTALRAVAELYQYLARNP
jgi:hypothetical protein